MNHAARRWALAGLVLVLVLLPVVASRYVVYLTVHILLLGLNAVGFNLLFGQTGLLSFGQAGFYAVGAYTCARILLAWPSLLPGVVGGTAAAALAALLLGCLSVRHTRIYFAMLTLAFGMMIFSLAWKWRAVTGGDDGLVGVPRAPLELFGLAVPLPTVERYYYVVLAAAVLGVVVMHRVVHSPLGLALRAVRDSEVRAAHVGLDVRSLRLVAFTVAGAYAGLAGSLLPPLENTVTPPIAHWTASAEPVLATLLGGIRSFAGPLVGAFVLVVAKDVIVRFTVHWSLVLGAVVVALVLGFRGGLVAALEGLALRAPRVQPAAAGEEGR
jgi:branched-chain amino acid transport system permease protein